MRVLFLLLIIANLGLFAWHTQTQRLDQALLLGPQPVDESTPPLLLLNELPKQTPPVEPAAPRESALQELPADPPPPTELP